VCARWLGVALVLLVGCADSEEGATDEPAVSFEEESDGRFCAALSAMFEAQERWTIDYLNSLTSEETLANRSEQREIVRPVRGSMPEQFVGAWDSTQPVGEEIDRRLDALRPPGGTTASLLAEVQAQGFGSLTEYVFRDGITVDGHHWTLEEYIEAGAALDGDLRTFCGLPPRDS
jgi:hypothetical protein